MKPPARRYVTLIQAAEGYPPAGEPQYAAPEGPRPPMLHTVVLEDDYKALEAEVLRLEGEVMRLTDRLQAALDG